MSVCFFVPTENASTSQDDNHEQENNQGDKNDPLEQQLNKFWTKVMDNIKSSTAEHFKTQILPLARIKKIMKLDEEVKMISAESPVLFAKAAEIFIHELTLRAWAHTEDNKRRTLQRNDVAMAISKSDQFDFLIDIVPRHDVKPIKREDVKCNNTEQVFVPGQPQTVHTTQQAPQQIVLQSYGQLQSSSSNSTPPPSTSTSTVQQPVQLLQQILSQNSEVPQMPLQLTQAQLNMIRIQMQNNPNQPIIIQAQPQQTQQLTPQIIQVTSQAQQPQQQVFLAQVATSQEDS